MFTQGFNVARFSSLHRMPLTNKLDHMPLAHFSIFAYYLKVVQELRQVTHF